MIARLGKEIDNPDSVYYWCYKVNLLTDLFLFELITKLRSYNVEKRILRSDIYILIVSTISTIVFHK